MQRMTYSDDQRTEALQLLADVGPGEASRRTGIPIGTIASWGHRAGVSSPNQEPMRAALEAKATTLAERRYALGDRMLGEAERILGQLQAPLLEKHVKVVSVGHNAGSEVEIVEVEYDVPPTADQKRIIDAVAVLVDKVQLLTGGATTRTEFVLPERTPEHEAEAAKVLELVA